MVTTPSSPPEDGRAEQITLSGGTLADLRERDGGWSLEVGGARQSHIGPAGRPPHLAAIRWMLAALGETLPATSAHLGGGLLTLPRAIAHRRPGAQQVVVESEPALVELTRTRFPLPAAVHVVLGDARAWLDEAHQRELDAVLIDVFAGDRIPPAFTSVECFAGARAVLADTGRLVINSVAGPDLDFTRRQLATMREVFEHVAMIVQGSALHGARFGNATLIGSPAPLDAGAIRAALAADPSRGALVTDLDQIIDGATPVTDEEGLWSPEPSIPQVEQALQMLRAAEELQHTVRTTLRQERDSQSDPNP